MLSPFLVSPLKKPYPLPLLPNPPTLTSWPRHSPILRHKAFTGTRASPPIDDQLGHPLLHVQLEPWAPPCAFFDWWFNPRELLGHWLVHNVVPPMGLQNPSSPWVLSLAPSLGTLCSNQWMTVSIHFSICQSLAEPLRRQLYQAPVSKILLASTNSVWVWWLFMGWIPMWSSLETVIPSVSALNLSLYLLPWIFCSPF